MENELKPKRKGNYHHNGNIVHGLYGETKTVVEWCELLGVSQYTVYDWIRKKGNDYAEQRLSEIA